MNVARASLDAPECVLHVDVRSKHFDASEAPVLSQLHIQVSRGETIALVGPSGCGKSTLLNIIAGLDTNFDGTVTTNLAGPPGYVFQTPRLMPWLTALENVALVVEGNFALARKWLTAVKMGNECELLPRMLSGGMQRRVALARAFAVQSGLLLMDEPFVSLDRPSADRLHALLHELLVEQAPAALFVTHDVNEALQVADRVLFLSARPASVLVELPLRQERPRQREDDGLLAIQRQLLAEHPRLLEGIAGRAQGHPT